MAEAGDFYALTRGARKVLAIENPALGDSIHLLPALKLLRDAYPQAELQVVGGPASFFQSVAPWIDRAWQPLRRKTTDNRPLMRALRAERIDAVYCFSGHNRANILANLIGARWRAGRRTDHNKPWWWQPLLYTRTVDYPWHREPFFLQHWHTARALGVPGGEPQFGAQVDPRWLEQAGIEAAARGSYLVVAPYYGFVGKELPRQQYVELLAELQHRYGRVVLSCGPKPREMQLLNELAALLPFQPYRVFAGNLTMEQYIGVVAGARLHLSGDSGGLHVARMAGTPSVSWYRRRWDYLNWAPAPSETAHRVVFTDDTSEGQCHGIDNAALLAAAQELIGPA